MSSATPVAPPPRLAPVWLGRRPHFGIGWLQGALAALALVLCFQGKARTAYAVLLFIAVPVLRLTLSAEYRGRVRARLAGFWHELERYPAEPAIPWRATLAFVVAPAAALLLLRGPAIMSGDSQPVMLQATSLVRHGSWDLSEYVQDYAGQCAYSPDGRLPYFLQAQGQGIYSAYPSGMVMFAVPVAAVARVLGADLGQTGVRDRLEKWTACWVACGCLALFFLLALHRVGPGPAWVMTALLATGSVIYSTVGQALWQHGSGELLIALSLLLVVPGERAPASRMRTALLGAVCVFMAANRPPDALIAGAIVLFIVWSRKRRAL